MLPRRAVGWVEQVAQAPATGQPGADVASVLVEAPAARVYATTLGDRLSQLTIAGATNHRRPDDAGGSPGSITRGGGAILKICHEPHQQCPVAG